MIDWVKNNWKTALVGAVVAVVILSLVCCNGEEAEVAPVEEAPVETLNEEVTE